MHRVQEATELFSKIQNAYQVLSDPQERAFYDRHRESILRKSKGQKSRVVEGGYSVEDLMAFFDTSVFKGYADDPKGFFTVYRELFAFLEDLEAEEMDNPARYKYASFGSKNFPFEPSLKEFYDKFMSFSSTRTFYEADSYDDSYAENRRHRRAIGKENQRARDTMRREYNDTVRNLAAWVRKRDPRWHSYQKARTVQREAAESRRKEEVLRKRAEQADAYVAPEWAVDHQLNEDFLLQQLERLQFEEFASQKDSVKGASGSVNDSGEDSQNDEAEEDPLEGFDDFYCVVCKKIFKNHKQWKNHEQSKKHRTNMMKAGFVESESEEEEEEEFDSEEVDFEENFETSADNISISSDSDSDSLETFENSEDDNEDSQEKKEINNFTAVPVPALPIDQMGQQKPPKKKVRSKQKPQKPTPEAKPVKSKKDKTSDVSLSCQICHQNFDSRNKLFKHIEDTGHATLKSGQSSKRK